MAFNNFLGRLGGAVRNSGILETVASSMTAGRSSPTDKTSVVEIVGRSNIEDVARIPIEQRAGCMILHGPCDIGLIGGLPTYSIILHQPSSTRMYSLYRTSDLFDAQNVFAMYKYAIPVLVELDSTICEKTTLDKICRKLRQPEALGWTAMHVAAAFDFHKYMGEQDLKKNIDYQCDSDLKTPLQVAIAHQSLSAVQELLKLGALMDLKDLMGNTIIHIGAESTVQILMLLFESLPERLGSIINEVNETGFTALHVACRSNNPEIVKALLQQGADVNIPTPFDGYPIHIAVKVRSICSIQELVARAPDQLNIKDAKDGGTPLHWAGGVDSLEILLELGCDSNIVNNSGQTPLHISARRGCLKSAICLLCHSAFPDMKDDKGETPLHLASRLCLKSLIQVLIVFGADLDLVNNQGESARHLICVSQRSDKDQTLYYLSAVGANRCPESMKNKCTRGCVHHDSTQFEGIPPENFLIGHNPNLMHDALSAFSLQKEIGDRSSFQPMEIDLEEVNVNNSGQTFRRRISPQSSVEAQIGGRLLCLDGGGIRGVVLTQILLFMEQECGVRIIDLFDWVAGTSTGGILALGLATGKSVAEIQGLYLRLKDKVFIGSRPYDSAAMDEFLKREFGEDTKMSNIKRPRCMITTALVERTPAEFHFFRNYPSPHSLIGATEPCCSPPENELVWECAKRTGAAPSFFTLEGRFIDGGLIANNPTLDALTELTQFTVALRAMGVVKDERFRIPSVVVSIGTGIQPSQNCCASHLDIGMPKGIMDAIIKVPRIGALVNLLVDQATQAEGQVVERSRAWCSSIGVPFFRFSPRMSTYIDLDEKSDETLINLMWETRVYMQAHKDIIVSLKHNLFQNGSPPPDVN